MSYNQRTRDFFVESRLVDASKGDPDALLELGIAFSAGTGGVAVDLVQAHKWFNLAALGGSEQAQEWRAEISAEMNPREIAEAQRQARAWISQSQLRAA